MIVAVIVFAVSEVAGCGLANLSDFFPGVIIISLQLVVVSQPGGLNQRENALCLALANLASSLKLFFLLLFSFSFLFLLFLFFRCRY